MENKSAENMSMNHEFLEVASNNITILHGSLGPLGTIQFRAQKRKANKKEKSLNSVANFTAVGCNLRDLQAADGAVTN